MVLYLALLFAVMVVRGKPYGAEQIVTVLFPKKVSSRLVYAETIIICLFRSAAPLGLGPSLPSPGTLCSR